MSAKTIVGDIVQSLGLAEKKKSAPVAAPVAAPAVAPAVTPIVADPTGGEQAGPNELVKRKKRASLLSGGNTDYTSGTELGSSNLTAARSLLGS